jgi:hypothetical protein
LPFVLYIRLFETCPHLSCSYRQPELPPSMTCLLLARRRRRLTVAWWSARRMRLAHS